MNLFFQFTLTGIYKFLTNSNQRELIWLALLYGNKKRYVSENIKFAGYKFLVPDCKSFIWQFKEIFVEEYYGFKNTNDTPVIFDCGANIGTSCAYFKQKYPGAKIIAFEANRDVSNILRKNLDINKIDNVDIVDKAVWINDVGVDLGLEASDSSSIYKQENKTHVPSIRLKDYIDKENTIDMLKMDIEGAEIEVLKDCRKSLSNVKNLFIEYHSFVMREQNLGVIINILEESGFRYYIKSNDDRTKPLVNRKNKSNPEMDLQLNIFAYREN